MKDYENENTDSIKYPYDKTAKWWPKLNVKVLLRD